MTKLVLDRNSFLLDSERSHRILHEVIATSSDLSASYPKYDEWIAGKVIPGIFLGERSIVIEYRDLQLAGFAIVKDTDIEQKLCCLRVFPKYQRSPLAVRLFQSAFELLENEKPLLSVSDYRYCSFAKIFDFFGFKQFIEYPNLYIKGVSELSFNGFLLDEDFNNKIERSRSNFCNSVK